MTQLKKIIGFKNETIQEVNEYVGTNHFDYRILRYCKNKMGENIKEIAALFNLISEF